MAKVTIDIVTTGAEETAAVFRRIAGAVEVSEESLTRFGQSAKRFGGELESIGRSLTIGLTLPLAALATVALKASIDFESAFADVRKTVTASAETFEMLQAQILSMAKTIPVAATELAKIAAIGGQFGIATEGLVNFTETVARLGVAVDGISAEQAATQLAQFAGIAKVATDDFDNLASVLVRLGNEGKSSEAEILALSTRLVAAGTLAGLTAAEIMGIAASLANVGVEAEAGGTAFSRIMREMTDAVKTGNASLAVFAQVAGQTSEAFATLFTESPAQAIEAFVAGLARLDAQGKSLTGVFEALGLADVRVLDTMGRVTLASQELGTNMAAASQEFATGSALVEESNKKFATTENQLILLKNSLSEVARQLGDALVPTLQTLISLVNSWLPALEQMVAAFRNLPAGVQTTIVVFAALLAALGPILATVGFMIVALGQLIVVLPSVSAGLAAVGASTGLMSAGFLGALGPIGAVVSALFLLDRAVVAVTQNQGIVDAVNNFAKSYVGVATEATNAGTAMRLVGDAADTAAKPMASAEASSKALADAWKQWASSVEQSHAPVIKTKDELQKLAAEGKAVQGILEGMQKTLLNLAIPDPVARSIVELRMETEKQVALHPQAAAAIRTSAKAIEDLTVEAAIATREMKTFGDALVLIEDIAIADLISDTVTQLKFMAVSAEDAAMDVALLTDNVEALVQQAQALEKLKFEYIPPEEAATRVAFLTDNVADLVREATILDGMKFEYVPREDQIAAWAFAADSVAGFVEEANRVSAETLTTDLAMIAAQAELLGPSFDAAGARVSVFRKLLDDELTASGGIVTDRAREINESLQAALSDQKLGESIKGMFLSVTDTFTKMANGLIQGTLDIGQAFADLGQSLLTNFVQLVIHQVFDPILEAAAAFVVDFAKTLLGGAGGAGWGATAGNFVLGLFGGGAGAGSAAAGLSGDIAFANAPGGLGLGGGGGGGLGTATGAVGTLASAYDVAAFFAGWPSSLSLISSGTQTAAQALGIIGPGFVSLAQSAGAVAAGIQTGTLSLPAAFGFGAGAPGAVGAVGAGSAVGGAGAGLAGGLSAGASVALGGLVLAPFAIGSLWQTFFGQQREDIDWMNKQKAKASAAFVGDKATALAGFTSLEQVPQFETTLGQLGGYASALQAFAEHAAQVAAETGVTGLYGDLFKPVADATYDIAAVSRTFLAQLEKIGVKVIDNLAGQTDKNLDTLLMAFTGNAAFPGGDRSAQIDFANRTLIAWSERLTQLGLGGLADAVKDELFIVKANFVLTVNAMKEVSDRLGLSVDRTKISLTDIQGSTKDEMQAFATNFQTQMVNAMMDAPPLTWAKMAGLFDLKGLQKGSETFEETAQRVGLALGSLRQMMLDLEEASRAPLSVSEALAETLTSIGEGMATASANLRSGDPSDTLLAAAQMLELIKAKWQAMTEAVQIAAAEVNTLTASLASGANAFAKWAPLLGAFGVSIDGMAATMTALVQTVPTVEAKLTALASATSLYGAQLQGAAPQGSGAVLGVVGDQGTALLASFQSALDAILTIEDPAQRMAALTTLLDQFGTTIVTTTDAVRAAYEAEIAAVSALVDAINTYASQVAAAGSAIASNAGWLAKAGIDIGAMASDMAAFSMTIPTVAGSLTALGSAVDLFGASLGVGGGAMDATAGVHLLNQFQAARTGGEADKAGVFLSGINEALAGLPAALESAFGKAMQIQDPGQRLEALTGILNTLGQLMGSLPPEVANALASAFGPEIQVLVGAMEDAAREQAAAAQRAADQLTTLLKSSGALTAENFIVLKIGEMNTVLGKIADGAGKFATDLAKALGDAGGDISKALDTASGELATVLDTLSTAVGELATAENAMALAASGLQRDLGGLATTIGGAMKDAVLAALQAHFPSPGGLPSAAMPTAQHGLDFVLGGLTRLHLGEMVLNPRAAEIARAMGITNAAMTNWPMMGARGREFVARARDVVMPYLRGGGDGAMAPLSIPITINISGSAGRAAEPLAKQIVELVTREIRYGSIGRAIDKRRRGEQ